MNIYEDYDGPIPLSVLEEMRRNPSSYPIDPKLCQKCIYRTSNADYKTAINPMCDYLKIVGHMRPMSNSSYGHCEARKTKDEK